MGGHAGACPSRAVVATREGRAPARPRPQALRLRRDHEQGFARHELVGNIAKLGMGTYCVWQQASICQPFMSGRLVHIRVSNALLLSVTPTNPPLCAHKSPTLCPQIPHFVAATSRVQACGSHGCWLLPLRVTNMPLLTADRCIWVKCPSPTLRH